MDTRRRRRSSEAVVVSSVSPPVVVVVNKTRTFSGRRRKREESDDDADRRHQAGGSDGENDADAMMVPRHRAGALSFFPLTAAAAGAIGKKECASPPRKRAARRAVAGGAGGDVVGVEHQHLDVGQKRFGVITCAVCGMMFTAGHPSDEERHARFCNDSEKALRQCTRWLKQGVDGVERVSAPTLGRSSAATKNTLWMVRHPTSERLCTRLLAVRRVVDRELGFASDAATELADYTVYLCTRQCNVVGCLFAHPVADAVRISPVGSGDKHSSDDESAADCSGLQLSQEDRQHLDSVASTLKVCRPAPAELMGRSLLGVSRVWVHPSCRRQGVAAALLDVARRTFCYGVHLAEHDVAFSQPTTAGKMLAMSYTGRKDFFVYSETGGSSIPLSLVPPPP